ncbi:hypothetical protein F5Y10DRAFT_228805 [Nemania abortiva]|nr:hypothetical protein F5Y10DRAFT_228805 [Nemania abortiva]
MEDDSNISSLTLGTPVTGPPAAPKFEFEEYATGSSVPPPRSSIGSDSTVVLSGSSYVYRHLHNNKVELSQEDSVEDWMQGLTLNDDPKCYPTDASKPVDDHKRAFIRQQVSAGRSVHQQRQEAKAAPPEDPLDATPRFMRRTEAQLIRQARRRELRQWNIVIMDHIRGNARRHDRGIVEEEYPKYAGEFWPLVERNFNRGAQTTRPVRRPIHLVDNPLNPHSPHSSHSLYSHHSHQRLRDAISRRARRLLERAFRILRARERARQWWSTIGHPLTRFRVEH